MNQPINAFDPAEIKAVVKIRFLNMMQIFPAEPSSQAAELALRFASYRVAIGLLADRDSIEQAHVLEELIFDMCVEDIWIHPPA
jgi:hypothetical protein